MIALEYISDKEITDEVSASTTFFPSLESLMLWSCPNLKGWWRRDIVDVATTTSTSSDQYQQHISLPYFPRLSYLCIVDCSNLTCMPLFPYLEEPLILHIASFKPLQQTLGMTLLFVLIPSSLQIKVSVFVSDTRCWVSTRGVDAKPNFCRASTDFEVPPYKICASIYTTSHLP